MKRILTLILAAAALFAAVAVPSAGESADTALAAIADSTVVIDGDYITRVAGIPTAAELKAQLEGGADIAVVGVADGEPVPNGTTVTCGDRPYTAVITGDVCPDAKLNSRDVIYMMRAIVSGTFDRSADVDLDKKMNARDVTALMRYLTGWDVQIGAEYFAYSEEPVEAPSEDATLKLFFGDNLTKKNKESDYVSGGATDTIKLAKNEIEFTQFFITSEAERSDLTVTATDFVSLKGDVMESELLAEYYFAVTDAELNKDVKYADALPPASLYKFKLVPGENQGFVIKAKSTADTPAGLYRSKISVTSGDGTVKRADVYARVWDFALSDETACKTAFGLGHYAIYITYRQYDPDDQVLYRAYYDFLLENRISAYYLPYSVLDDRADEYMSNPRVTSFMIDGRDHPNGGRNGDMTDAELAEAYEKLSANPDWMKKGYFYYVDEPHNYDMIAEISESVARLNEFFPDYRLTVPYYMNTIGGSDLTSLLYDCGVNLWCPLSSFWTHSAEGRTGAVHPFDYKTEKKFGTAEERFGEFVKEGDELWWYVCISPQYPYANFFSTYQGALTRVLFWQQYSYDIDGLLYWSVNYWQSGAEWRTMDTGFAYGDGRLIYCGSKYGIRGPISSIRLEIVRDGIEDFQYMKMAEELIGKERVDEIVRTVTKSILTFTHDGDVIRTARNALGEAIEKAVAGN